MADAATFAPGDATRAHVAVVEGPEERPPTLPTRIEPRFLALLRLDVSALARGHTADGELCEIAGVGPVPVPVALDLLGESVLKLIVTRGQDIANVTHLGRGPSAAQRAALLWLNPMCSNEACNRRAHEWDHRVPWAKVKRTDLANIDGLCRHDHHLKTHQSWALVDGRGRRPFVPPDDPRHPRRKNRRRHAADGRAGPDPPHDRAA